MNQLYSKLAWTNIKNNSQLYLPYLLMGMLSAAMVYTMLAMQYNEGIGSIRGASFLEVILKFGTDVIGIFVFIFLFYTNSFIIKRRKKEIGIYNILGMEKRHIARELTWETLFIAFAAIAGGLSIGIVFNKFIVMILYKMVSFSSPIQFYISGKAIVWTVELFGIIYAAVLIYNMMQVKLAKPVELLHGGNVGEKEPKTKVLMTLIGVAAIATGYYIAITTENPLEVVDLFFAAVVLVIIGTYCLFTAGSIAFLKALRRNKKFYYQTKHFTAVSGLIYRMKQNAVGLANICILSTMVLVMASTTICMYAGIDDEVKVRYPREISIDGSPVKVGADHSMLADEVKGVIRENGRTVLSELSYTSLDLVGILKEESFLMEGETADNNTLSSDLTMLTFLIKDDFERSFKTVISDLKAGEVEIFGKNAYRSDELHILNKTYKVKGGGEFPSEIVNETNLVSLLSGGYYIVVLPNEAALEEIYEAQKEVGVRITECSYYLYVEIDGNAEERIICDNAVNAKLIELDAQQELTGCYSVRGEFRELNRINFYTSNGGFLFLGLFLGIMFLIVTVLIIFYKQISEGYEDRERFAIMKRVGMSSREVKSAVSTQIRMVFFLPIATAALHVVAAFPMLKRLLQLMYLANGKLFAICLVGTILVFGIIYMMVFLMTSRSYYKIVGNQC